ncbi:uncharacterized protein LOC111449505 [Cucurbita moschata]|uniref:Uncharacterized protein LOC111449505 n=1 Tax=Cucurbita moschata TaxID=3662 RepID=A0A6J1G057_CUCMO|nr:uncharacterized protein LOC111449505 [Cucurbita moschata]
MVILPLLLSKGSSCLGSKKKEREKKRKRVRMEKGEEVRVWERGRTEMTNSHWRSNPRQETSKQYFSQCWKRSSGGGIHSFRQENPRTDKVLEVLGRESDENQSLVLTSGEAIENRKCTSRFGKVFESCAVTEGCRSGASVHGRSFRVLCPFSYLESFVFFFIIVFSI